MQRLFLILALLFVSVITTACINNFAVQELNNKAKVYLQAGDVDKAICRLKSSLELDSNLFETNYNLGVAYIQAEEYDEALKALNVAQKINPDAADTYYSIAVAQESLANNLTDISVKNKDKNKDVNDDEDDTEIQLTQDGKVLNQKNEEKPKELTDAEKIEITKLLSDSIDNYNKYLTINTTSTEKDKVNERINSINEDLKKYTTENKDAAVE